MKQSIKFLLSAFAAMFVGVTAFAQLTTSSLNGLVADASGEPVIGAAVIATHTESGTSYATVTNNEGRYYINGVLSSSKTLTGDFKFPASGRGWFGIGGDPDTEKTASNAWCGDIVTARVYNDALTAEEVTALWNDVKGGVGLDGVKANSEQKDAIYTINGIRVQKTQKGVYIINGKTVLVK